MTLRARLLTGVLTLLAVLGAAGIFVAARQRSVQLTELDRRLDAVAANAWRFDQLLRRGGDGRPDALFGDLYIAVANDDALTSIALPTDDPGLIPDIDATLLTQPGRHATVGTVAGATDRLRVVVVDTGRTTLVIGASSEPAERAYRNLRKTIVLAGLAVLAVLGALTYWVLRLGLRPIREMTETADAIVAGDSKRRASALPRHTEAGRLGYALNTMIDTNQRSEARLRQFVADASHELRTPLTTLRGYVRLYEQGGLREDGELVDAMERISREANRMGLLVDDLLLLAQLDHSRPIAREPVDMGQLLHDLADDVRVIQPNRRIHVNVEGNLTVHGDAGRLAQAVGALVTNAWRHTADDRAITLSAHRTTGRVRVEITDEGDGIAAEHLPHLFDRFYRADPARSRDRGGSGLGLAIVAAIASAHDGSYGAISAIGQGSTFWIELPDDAPVDAASAASATSNA